MLLCPETAESLTTTTVRPHVSETDKSQEEAGTSKARQNPALLAARNPHKPTTYLERCLVIGLPAGEVVAVPSRPQ